MEQELEHFKTPEILAALQSSMPALKRQKEMLDNMSHEITKLVKMLKEHGVASPCAVEVEEGVMI